ncbi:trypsin-like peptidase domain-containing protein [Xylophilus sp. GW821-FHT01B05]
MLRRFGQWWATGVLAGVLAACGGGGDGAGTATSLAAQSAPEATSPATPHVAVDRAESFVQTDAGASELHAPRARSLRAAPRASAVALQPLSTARAAAEAPVPGTPRRIGVGRVLSETADSAGTRSRLRWSPAAGGGQIAALSFTSPGAVELRLGLLVRQLPTDAVLRIYAQKADTAYEVSGREVLATIQRNLDAGDSGDAARTWWAPAVTGEEATVEILLPAGAKPSAVELSVPRLSHLYASAADSEVNLAKIGQSASCEIDVTCTSGNDDQSNATARLSFVDSSDGGSYLCTGTLVADSAASGIPYLLTANHCISNQSTASTLTTNWFYRAASCGRLVTSASVRTLTGGAALLYATSDTDTAFLRLNAQPPAGVVYAGWSSSVQSLNTSAVSVHHPEGDLQKFTSGYLQSFLSCGTGLRFSCYPATSQTGNYLNAIWTSGTTESGSSGSGLFSVIGGKRYLVGQLYGGSASCSLPSGSNIYGRLDVAYNAALSQWLNPVPAATTTATRTPVYRFYNGSTRAHFYTTNAAERDYVIANYSAFSYEGPAFYAYANTGSGLSPVYRFFNTRTGAHFFTISASERDYVVATYPEYAYEGPAWYAQTGEGNGAQAVYRFYNTGSATHFYTINQAERDYVQQNYSAFNYEGVGYYAWTAQ